MAVDHMCEFRYIKFLSVLRFLKFMLFSVTKMKTLSTETVPSQPIQPKSLFYRSLEIDKIQPCNKIKAIMKQLMTLSRFN